MPEIEYPSRQIAVIDIGSNSVRLVLYRLEGRAVWTMFNEKVLAGLGRDIAVTGKLYGPGVDMAMVALRRFSAVIEGVQPDMVLTAATAAVREASDGPAFCERVYEETGLDIRVLTGEEEARYAALGVRAGDPTARGVVGDLGGASLELNRLGATGPGITLPLGPFVLAGSKDFDAKRVENRINKVLATVTDDYRSRTFNAVGGAWRTLAQMHMEMTDHPLRIVHQYAMTADEARELADRVIAQSRASLEKHPGVSKRRAETLPYAALNLKCLIDRLGFETIHFSAWGVREGLLHAGLDDHVRAIDPLLAGCSAWGGRQGVDPALPRALDGWLQPIASALPEAFDEERDALLMSSVCRLADIGARLHPDHRPELVFDQVLWSPIAGQNHAERAFLATAMYARYGGANTVHKPGVVDRLLHPAGVKRARALGLAMRLACDLSGRSPQLLSNAAISISKGTLRVTAVKGYGSMLLGSQTRRRAKALADAMGLELAEF
ncbi:MULTISPECIES: Ppx/GppA phosphatase family protein [unclassified Brevundimonas]|uniref:Ppx/GppA phosphatase family protein n=1 Tax=unclassified Brevundimonas TaxID=2622653 RepID=UPI0025B7FFE4|nr:MULTISPECIES: Ppx/GppA phosphatase family protein [unclassified Brevundimonas]